jgi:hypothetical protein
LITLYEYNQLSKDEQGTVLWSQGRFLVNRATTSHKINLYALDRFYVEVWLKDGGNEIDRIRSFSSSNQLEPYLSLIDIAGL